MDEVMDCWLVNLSGLVGRLIERVGRSWVE